MGAGDAQVRGQDVITAEDALSTAVGRGTKAFLEQASHPLFDSLLCASVSATRHKKSCLRVLLETDNAMI